MTQRAAMLGNSQLLGARITRIAPGQSGLKHGMLDGHNTFKLLQLSRKTSYLWNPQLHYLPNLYNDLLKVFQFHQEEKKVSKLVNSKERPICSGEKAKTSDLADASESDSAGDSQSDKELAPPVEKHIRANRKHIDSITLVDIAQYFHLPIRDASKTLKIGVSILKRKCRQYGIPRWPHRKIKSLDSLIHDLEYVLANEDEEEDKKQLQKDRLTAAIVALTKRKSLLEIEKETIQQKPTMDLMAETKVFREDVFKRRYRAKSSVMDDMDFDMG